MKIDRRTLLTGLSAALLTSRGAKAATITDGAGRAVRIPDRIARVFPAGPPAAIMLYTLAPDLLIGWPRANRKEECEYMLPDICARPEVGRVTGRGNTANFEAVLNFKPDLFLDVGSTTATYVSLATRVEEQTKIPYALLDGRLVATAASYRTLGALIGRRAEAEKLARYFEETTAAIKKRITSIPSQNRPRVYYARGPRGLETGRGGSINMETIEFLGARNVAGEKSGGLMAVSMEQVLIWNPDIIITIDRDFAANVRTDQVWSTVNAVKNNRVYLSPKLPFGWVDFPPSVNRLAGLWWLAKILYTQQFPEDIRPPLREFYRLFYHVTLSNEQIERVIAAVD